MKKLNLLAITLLLQSTLLFSETQGLTEEEKIARDKLTEFAEKQGYTGPSAVERFIKAMENGIAVKIRWNKESKEWEPLKGLTDEELFQKFLAMTKDDKSILEGGPTKETIIAVIFEREKHAIILNESLQELLLRFWQSGKSFSIQRGNQLESRGYESIPSGVSMYPIRLKGEDGLLFTYYFFQDEFNDWKALRKDN